MNLIDILGWIGSATYLVAFALNSAQKITSDSFIYQGMNILAGAIMTYYTFNHGAYSATVLNSIWAIIGISALVNKLWNKNQDDETNRL